jgi:hypothetical protein
MPFPLIAAGVGAAVSAFGKYKAGQARAGNDVIDMNNKLKANLYQQKQFTPFAPFSTLAKGRLFAASARAWGFDKILGNKYLEHISNAGNVPGTSAIGGGADLQMPKFEKKKTGGIWDIIAAGGQFASDLGKANMGGGGGGGVPGGTTGGNLGITAGG